MKAMRSFAFALFVGVCAVAAVASSAWDRTCEAVSSGIYRLKGWAFDLLGLSPTAVAYEAERKPLIARVRQVAYRLRQVRRHRAVVTPRWRMCPSG